MTDFFSLRNFLASAMAALSSGSSSESETTCKALARRTSVHLEDVREVLLAGTAGRRPCVDQGVLDLLVLRSAAPGTASSSAARA